jgi:hypothetical protein
VDVSLAEWKAELTGEMQTAAVKPRIPAGIIVLEMAGAIEHWRIDTDGSVQILLAQPIPCGDCKAKRCWLVNRLGKTRCADCDRFAREGGIQLIEART